MSAKASSTLYIVAVGALCLVSFGLSFAVSVSWDVAWRLEIAERLLKGASLYRDVIELNPPLWFWSALPSTFLANALGLSPFVVLSATIHFVALVSIWLFDRCIEPITSRTQRIQLVVGALAALILVPMIELGQREPPVLLAGLLWSSLAVARAKGATCPPWMVIGIAVLSAYGFALKHYYLVIPIGVEIWLLLQLKRSWQIFRLETLILAGLGAVYGVAVLTLAPHFLTDIVPLIGLSYDEVRSSNVANPYLHPLSMLYQAFVLLAPAILISRFFKKDMLLQVLLLVLSLHLLVVFIQGKGFGNHYLAAKGTVFVLWACACGGALMHEKRLAIPTYIMLGFLVFTTMVTPIRYALSARQQLNVKITQPQSSRIMVVSTNAGLAFYLQWYQSRAHFSRYYAMWMLPGLLTSQRMPERHDGATAQLNLVRANMIADIKCAAPHVIIGDTTTHGRSDATGFHTYDIKPMTFLQSDLTFAQWLSDNYVTSAETFGTTIWRPKNINGPPPSQCSFKYR
jgi:hypothetical protein